MGTIQLRKFKSLFTGFVLALSCLLLVASAAAQSVPPELFNALKWRLIGPFRGGRVVAVAGVPDDPTTFYFGAVNGGIWKTTDAGVVWTPIFDGQSVASIGAIAVALSDSKIIYAGTGETDIRSDLSSGTGVYKSVDAGRTWTHIGLEDTRQISRIVIDPRNPDVVYVGALGHAYGPNADRGVYKSEDGGSHWAKMLDLGPDVGVSDLAICSGNPRLLYAGMWHTWRPPWSAYPTVDGPGGGLFRSSDGGKTWSRLNGTGLPAGDWGRVGVDVAADGKRVYALIQAKQAGLYRSDDGGDSWVLVNADPRLTSRAWYFNSVTVDPNNADVLYVPNVALYRSEDGGKTISVVRGAPGGDDYHQLWIDPKNSSRMVLGTDQGTTVSLDRGQTWSTWYNQPTAQIYRLTTDNQFPYVVYGTQQDSGSAAVPSRTDHGQITPRDWFPVGSSESGSVALDPADPDIVYLSEPYGGVARYNRKTGFSQDVSPWPLFLFEQEINRRKYRDPWTPVLIASPLQPKTLFLGTQFVMKTVDGGLHWDTISPDLTGADPDSAGKAPGAPLSVENAKQRGFGVVYTIAPSYLNRDVIWAGSDTGLIHLTRDGGKTWKDVTPSGLSDWSRISRIEASHFDPAVAYAAVDRSIRDDRGPYIYRTRDYGATWKLTAGGISAPAFVRTIREDPQISGLLYAGTEFGIYVSFDDGENWQSLQLNLPVTGVRDLTVHGDDLVIATYGRSFWILDDITPLRQTGEAAKASPAWLYRPATTVRVDNDSFPGTPLPPEESTAENPPNGAVIDYVLKSEAGSVKLEIFDAQQKSVRIFSSDQAVAKHPPLPVAERWFPKPARLDKTPGMHRFVWDLAWRSSGGPSADEENDSSNPAGPRAMPATYQVRLTVDGQEQSQSLMVVMDPRSPATPEVLAQQFQLGQQIFTETMEARRALAEIGSVQRQLVDIQGKLEDSNPQLKLAVAEAQAAIRAILSNSQKDSDRAAGLKDAYEGLTSALRVVKGGDREVPSQAVAVYKESSQQASARIREWGAFKRGTLPALNQQLRNAKFASIAISEIEQTVEFLMTR